jgi:choline dehydrogenase-like flavoprotein
MVSYDIIIIGSGAGGGTLAYALRDSGANILILERGDFLPNEDQNWQVEAVFKDKRYKPDENWHDVHNNTQFQPGVHYFVGGNTKVYGAALPRFRERDFQAIEHEGGTSPAWAISYTDLEPYYTQAELIYRVHGVVDDDPTAPPRSQPYPFPPVPHEPYIEDLSDTLKSQGLNPFYMPIGIDLREGGACIRCNTCDGFPCKVNAKSDADTCCIKQVVDNDNITLWTNTYVRRVLTDDSGKRATAVEIERDGEIQVVHGDTIIVSCGAVNSAALLLRSANEQHPKGLANSSDLVGRNYMVHNNTAMTAVAPFKINSTVFQKTMAVNDFYFGSPYFDYPMGNLQLIGKLQAGMLSAAQPLVPKPILRGMAKRSVDWWVMSEDLPDLDNRITLDQQGNIQVHWKPNNLIAHEQLIQHAKQMLRDAGYLLVFVQRMGIETNSHQCGTIRFGSDPKAAVLDSFCRTYDVENLFVVDSSFFPSSTAMNPALTIAAQALRVADRIMNKSLQQSPLS